MSVKKENWGEFFSAASEQGYVCDIAPWHAQSPAGLEQSVTTDECRIRSAAESLSPIYAVAWDK